MASIHSTTVDLPKTAINNIEDNLKSLGYDVLRWAIVHVNDNSVVVSLSYITG